MGSSFKFRSSEKFHLSSSSSDRLVDLSLNIVHDATTTEASTLHLVDRHISQVISHGRSCPSYRGRVFDGQRRSFILFIFDRSSKMDAVHDTDRTIGEKEGHDGVVGPRGCQMASHSLASE